jgi:hypothetical protein
MSLEPTLLQLATSLQTKIENERQRWLTTAAQEAIDDALDHLNALKQCIVDIHDDPSATDSKWVRPAESESQSS